MCKLSAKVWEALRCLFEKLAQDGCSVVTREKAHAFFDTFKSVNVDALFNECDADNNGVITAEEFIDFWLQVRSNGYSEQQILEVMGGLRQVQIPKSVK